MADTVVTQHYLELLEIISKRTKKNKQMQKRPLPLQPETYHLTCRKLIICIFTKVSLISLAERNNAHQTKVTKQEISAKPALHFERADSMLNISSSRLIIWPRLFPDIIAALLLCSGEKRSGKLWLLYPLFGGGTIWKDHNTCNDRVPPHNNKLTTGAAFRNFSMVVLFFRASILNTPSCRLRSSNSASCRSFSSRSLMTK